MAFNVRINQALLLKVLLAQKTHKSQIATKRRKEGREEGKERGRGRV